MDLHERIAKALGWTVKDTQGFSMPMLREMIRDKDPALAHEIAVVVREGRHITRREK